MKKSIGMAISILALLAPALARAELKEMKQTVFGMD